LNVEKSTLTFMAIKPEIMTTTGGNPVANSQRSRANH
jgi:hypothetical protein